MSFKGLVIVLTAAMVVYAIIMIKSNNPLSMDRYEESRSNSADNNQQTNSYLDR